MISALGSAAMNSGPIIPPPMAGEAATPRTDAFISSVISAGSIRSISTSLKVRLIRSTECRCSLPGTSTVTDSRSLGMVMTLAAGGRRSASLDRSAGGLTHMHFGLDEILREMHRLAIQLVQQRAGGAAAYFPLAVPHRCQGWRGDGRFLQVVVASDGNIHARCQAGTGYAIHQADSDEIVPAAGSRRPVLQGEELAG